MKVWDIGVCIIIGIGSSNDAARFPTSSHDGDEPPPEMELILQQVQDDEELCF
jgi:hypothetical protein